MLALEFPPINEILRWRDLAPSFNKIAIIAVLAALVGTLIFLLAGNQDGMKAPKGVRNLAESIVEFIENQIVMPTIWFSMNSTAPGLRHSRSPWCWSTSPCRRS